MASPALRVVDNPGKTPEQTPEPHIPTVVQFESFSQCLASRELEPLLRDCYLEAFDAGKHAPFNPDYQSYFLKERIDQLIFATARKDGRLVGFLVGSVGRGPYDSVPSFYGDTLYVVPDFRAGMVHLRLLRTTIVELMKLGIKQFTAGSSLHHDIGRLFEALGFAKAETYYRLWLGE